MGVSSLSPEVFKDSGHVIIPEYLADLRDALPIEGWEVCRHKNGGRLVWGTGNKIDLYLDYIQIIGGFVDAKKLSHRLSEIAHNANMLDYLLKYSERISDEWKGKRVAFWGTKYRRPRGPKEPYIRVLYWDPRKSCWRWEFMWLGFKVEHDCYAAVRLF